MLKTLPFAFLREGYQGLDDVGLLNIMQSQNKTRLCLTHRI